MSVELRPCIPIFSGIPDFLSCIPYSKAQDSGFHEQNVSGFSEMGAIIACEQALHFGAIVKSRRRESGGGRERKPFLGPSRRASFAQIEELACRLALT